MQPKDKNAPRIVYTVQDYFEVVRYEMRYAISDKEALAIAKEWVAKDRLEETTTLAKEKV
jgi:hypothetical protein